MPRKSKKPKITAPKAASKPAAKPELKPSASAASTPVSKAPASTAPKAVAAPKPTPVKRYSPAVKSAILSAAIAARGAGKKWAEALQAAKAVGYRGSLQGIVKMIRAGNRKQHMRKAAAKPKAVKRRVGRPKGSGKRLGRPPLKPVSVNGLESIQAAVDQIVRERVSAALDRAIAVLETAR